MSPEPSPPQPPPPEAPQPQLGANFFGFPNLDLGAPDSFDFMTFFDSSMLGSFDDAVFGIGSADDVSPETFNPTASARTRDPDAAAVVAGGNRPTAEESIARLENQFNTAANNVPGAGPLPPGTMSQMALSGSGGSTLTEFTKRKQWPAKVVEELKDFLHILDANGRIKYASPSVLSVAGYTAEEIFDEFLKDLIHPDDQGIFVSELNESIASGTPLRIFYRFKKKDGTYAIFESVGHAHIADAKFAPNPDNQSPFCQSVFMMSRPYPTKNAGLLDSFLEHKIENERLRQRIAELRMEEEADADEESRQWAQLQDGRSDATPPEPMADGSSRNPLHPGAGGEHVGNEGEEDDGDGDGVPLTRESLEDTADGTRLDAQPDGTARYGAPSHTDTIEMLTGLRYVEGERCRGITAGMASPVLVKGDAGIEISLDRDSRMGEKKKKKLKTSEEYVCTDCGTLDSPEWRKGPSGPKTLCNACGLRWAKKEKKKGNFNGSSQLADQATT
ncbi:white-collar 2 [Drechmeria coniospora]|uniref:White-collar 2 n=1 Tax=Drechmeria coniospora TaxID=98403 RepID=A0A151GW11_DRECN|nr:white-collar 2 [Drechmeria coniospora]KYK61289.1 white-collar 2 [Drechmeria coniospora]ODA81053.1 hypothetical protein RJ55_04015 [Drechmeria coniospora]